MKIFCFEIGRASASPTIDLFVTLLKLGLTGYHQILKERKVLSYSFLFLEC